MIELRTLGSIDLRGTDGHPVQSVLAQPRRVALLAYLALASPAGFHRRETLLGLFWPESSTDNARNSLRQAVHQLRRSLGEGVIQRRGDEEIGVDPSKLRCDAVAFEQAVAAGSLQEAAEQYRGEFLPGFFIADAPEFERWLDGTRARLQQKAHGVLWTLAEEKEKTGDPRGAAEFWHRLAEQDPLDARVVLRLMQALAAVGNRTEALSRADRFVVRVREDLGVEPPPEVLAFAEELRTGPVPLSRAAQAPHSAGDGGEAGTHAEPAVARTERAEPVIAIPPAAKEAAPAASGRIPTWGRWLLVPALVAVLALAVWALREGRAPGDVSPDSSRVVVFPFTYRGDPEFAYLGEGIVDLLSTNLDGAGELRTVDPHALLTFLAHEPTELLSPVRGQEVALQFGAGLYVRGEIIEAGQRVRIRGALYDADGEAEPLVRAAVEGDATDLFRLVDELTAQLLAGQLSESGAQLASVATRTTSSLPALKAYLDGESHFRSRRYPAAIEAFQQAVTEDSSFALAHYRLSVVADWAHEYTLAGEAALRAARHKERLPEHYRLLVDGLIAWHLTQPDEAHNIYRTALERYPTDVEGWYRLGEVFFHYNPLRGRPVEEAREPFERVLALDPQHQGALIHLASLAARQRERESLDRYVELILAESPEDSLEWRALRAFAVGDRSEQDRVVSALRGGSDQELVSAAKEVALNTQNLSGAARLSRLLTEPTRPSELRVAGHIFRAHLEVAQGRWSGAKRELSEVESLNPAAALAFRALLASVHVLPLPRAEVEAIRDALVRWDAPATPNPYMSWYSDLGPYLRIYMLGLLSARLEDYTAALSYAAQLEQVDESPAAAARGRAMAAAIRARVEFTRGNPAEALAWLDRMRFEGSEALPLPPLGFVGYQRHLRPELLRELGREREGLRWYGAVRWISAVRAHSYLELPYLAPWHLRQAEIYDRLGERERAVQHYTRFVEMWGEADPELRDQVTRARRRLAALRGR